MACHALEDDFQFYSIRFVSAVRYDGGDLLTDYSGIPTMIQDTTKNGKEYFEKNLLLD